MGHKYWRAIASLLILFILLFGWAVTVKAPTASRLSIKNHKFNYKVADTPAEQAKGLGGRDNLPTDQAMLFQFQNPSRQCFWMKDMRFSIDIIWLNTEKKVVHIEPNLSPDSFPKSYCVDNTKYVIEVNANITQQLKLHNGETISF